MTVAIIDYGSGNLHSAAKAFERATRSSENPEKISVTRDPDAVFRADRIVLPGVGAFADCRRGLDALDGQSRDLGDARRGIVLDALAEGVPPERVLLDELAILGAPGDHHVQQSERQRRIGARPRRQMLVGPIRAARADRIDHDDVRALAAGGSTAGSRFSGTRCTWARSTRI